MKIKKLGIKISALALAIIILIVSMILGVVYFNVNSIISNLTNKNLSIADNIFEYELNNYKDDVLLSAAIMSESKEIVNAIQQGDVKALKEECIAQGSNLDAVVVCDKDGVILMATDSDESAGYAMQEESIKTTFSSGNGVSRIEYQELDKLFVRGTSLVKNDAGEVIALIACQYDLSDTKYVDSIKVQSECEHTIFAGTTRLNTTLADDSGARIVGTKTDNTKIISTVIDEGKQYIGTTTISGKPYVCIYSPIIENGKTLGMMFSGIDVTQVTNLKNQTMSVIVFIAIISVILSLVLFVNYSRKWITIPLRKLEKFAESLKEGELKVEERLSGVPVVDSHDEIGQLAIVLEETRQSLNGYIIEIQLRMNELAQSDLTKTTSYDFKGDFVEIKDSINKINLNLNDAMYNIISSSKVVNRGANEIASSSNVVASSSSEQSVNIAQINNVVSKIADQVQKNADSALEASELSQTIKLNAEQGSMQMDEMLIAVKEINEASESINRVMQVIHDIAKQTNILAINASVEAGRAGEAGKGFAVVAQEIRNLALKSQGAAKETNDLVLNSMAKAEMGAKIASKTAGSLSEIVEGINKSNDMIRNISKLSQEQSNSIDYLNESIKEVAAGIEETSTAAEQSAASGQELNSQANILNDLVSRFKLKN